MFCSVSANATSAATQLTPVQTESTAQKISTLITKFTNRTYNQQPLSFNVLSLGATGISSIKSISTQIINTAQNGAPITNKALIEEPNYVQLLNETKKIMTSADKLMGIEYSDSTGFDIATVHLDHSGTQGLSPISRLVIGSTALAAKTSALGLVQSVAPRLNQNITQRQLMAAKQGLDGLSYALDALNLASKITATSEQYTSPKNEVSPETINKATVAAGNYSPKVLGNILNQLSSTYTDSSDPIYQGIQVNFKVIRALATNAAIISNQFIADVAMFNVDHPNKPIQGVVTYKDSNFSTAYQILGTSI